MDLKDEWTRTLDWTTESSISEWALSFSPATSTPLLSLSISLSLSLSFAPPLLGIPDDHKPGDIPSWSSRLSSLPWLPDLTRLCWDPHTKDHFRYMCKILWTVHNSVSYIHKSIERSFHFTQGARYTCVHLIPIYPLHSNSIVQLKCSWMLAKFLGLVLQLCHKMQQPTIQLVMVVSVFARDCVHLVLLINWGRSMYKWGDAIWSGWWWVVVMGRGREGGIAERLFSSSSSPLSQIWVFAKPQLELAHTSSPNAHFPWILWFSRNWTVVECLSPACYVIIRNPLATLQLFWSLYVSKTQWLILLFHHLSHCLSKTILIVWWILSSNNIKILRYVEDQSILSLKPVAHVARH